jgi:adenine-specific DNA-methyltransferase
MLCASGAAVKPIVSGLVEAPENRGDMNRLQLYWVGKEHRFRLEPRILLEDPAVTYRRSPAETIENLLVHGDNLLALKALEGEYAGKVKCIYIDPPYNTGSAFIHYDDGMEHSLWLTMIRDRVELLWSLLAEDGTLWVSIDDSEAGYLRVLLDEICGRQSFVACNVWQKRYSRENRESIGDAHEYVFVYAKDALAFKRSRNKLPLEAKQLAVYKNPNGDPKGPWRSVSFSAQGFRPNQMYTIVSPITGKRHVPPEGSCWKVIEERYKDLLANKRMYFGKDGNAVPSRIQYLSEIDGVAPWTWWPHEEVGHTDESKKEVQALFGKTDSFATPKPERLLQRIIHIATNPGDLVLDSFAGSGTTGAVAHKMGRRWIMVEMGEHCRTHIVPRLQKVIDGADPGGVTEATGWTGGGGFRFLRLAPSLMEKDQWGRWVINRAYRPEMVAEAICRLEGFAYAPSDSVWWQHGSVGDRSFLYVTTESMTHEQLAVLSAEVGAERALLVCCAAYDAVDDEFPNLQFRKLPHAVLSRCEWGRDDYSVPLAEAPPPDAAADDEPAASPAPATTKRPRGRPKSRQVLSAAQGGLFGGDDEGGER